MTNGWGYTNRPANTLTNAVFRAWGGMTGVRNAVTKAQQGGVFVNSPHGDGSGEFVQSVRITVEEAATLQSYPPDFIFTGNKGAKGLQVGNAVPPLVAQAVLESLWKE